MNFLSISNSTKLDALTLGLLEALETLGANAKVSNRQLFDQTTAILKSLQFKQIPVLHEPPNAPGLQDKSFITLQPISASKDYKTPAFSGSLIEPIETKHKGAPIMSTVKPPVLNLDRSLTEADAQFCAEVIKCSLQVMPTMLQAVNQQDSKANGQHPIGNSKFWTALIPPLIGVIPTIFDAIRGKNWKTESDAPISEEKFWTQVIPAILPVIPSIIDAVTKGATDSKNFEPQESSAAPGVVPLPVPASNGANGAASAEVDEELVDAVMARLASTLMAAR